MQEIQYTGVEGNIAFQLSELNSALCITGAAEHSVWAEFFKHAKIHLRRARTLRASTSSCFFRKMSFLRMAHTSASSARFRYIRGDCISLFACRLCRFDRRGLPECIRDFVFGGGGGVTAKLSRSCLLCVSLKKPDCVFKVLCVYIRLLSRGMNSH